MIDILVTTVNLCLCLFGELFGLIVLMVAVIAVWGIPIELGNEKSKLFYLFLPLSFYLTVVFCRLWYYYFNYVSDNICVGCLG